MEGPRTRKAKNSMDRQCPALDQTRGCWSNERVMQPKTRTGQTTGQAGSPHIANHREVMKAARHDDDMIR